MGFVIWQGVLTDTKKGEDFDLPVCFLGRLPFCISNEIFSGLKTTSRLIIYDFVSRFVSHTKKTIIFIDYGV